MMPLVKKVCRSGDAFVVHTDRLLLTARNVITATGAFQTPRLPPFAAELDPAILQVHSSPYRNPDQLPSGPVLVVGAGNSGTQIALELATTHEVWLAGPEVGRLPRCLLGKDIYWWIWLPVLNAPLTTRRGRPLKEH